MNEGIYFGMSAEEYHAAPGLSHSGMRELAVSPLRYWHRYVNPDRTPQEPTPAQRLGTALHYLILEPGAFALRYGRKLRKEDHPKALVTIDDLKGWLAGNGLPTGHKRKQDLIDRIQEAAAKSEWAGPVLWDLVVEQHARENAGRELLDPEEFARIEAAASVARADPLIDALLSDGYPEVSIFVRDPETGVLLKCRLDHVTAQWTVDLKSFTNRRAKEQGQAIVDAIWYEGYYQQAVWYHDLRELASRKLAAGDLVCHGEGVLRLTDALSNHEGHRFAFVFVESEPPHELGAVLLAREPLNGAQPEEYWSEARRHQRRMVRLFAECRERFGDSPWRDRVEVRELLDADMPQLRYAESADLMPAGLLEASEL